MIKFLQTPGKAKKYVLGGLLLVICAAMVITLIPGGFLGDAFGFGTPAGVVAKVGDQEVTISEAQQMARQMGRQQFPRGIPQQLMPFLTQRAVDGLIMQKAILVEAGRMGLKVTDEELRDALQRVFKAQLFPNGNFVGDQAYADFVQQSFQLSIPQFEQDFKTSLLINKLRNVIEGAATTSDQELLQEYNRKNTKVKFDYAVLTYDDILKQIKPTDAELKAFFDKNKDLYKGALPEKRKADYIVIDTAKLQQAAQVTPDDLKRYYSQHQDEYRVPEEVNVRQIVIKAPAPGPDGKVDQKATDAARARAQDIANKIKAGGNFADLAKKSSEDTATAKNGGELGWVRRGQTMPEIDKAAFSIGKGQTSDVIQTALGFFIIQVEDKHSAGLKPLEEVKPTIEPIIAQEKAAKQADALANKLQAEARTNGLSSAAQKNNLNLVSTGFVAMSDSLPGVGAAPELMQALFQAKEKNPPDTVRTPQGFVIFQVQAIQPPATPTLDEIKARVEGDFKNERAGALLAQKTQQLADRAHASHDLKAAAKEVGATVKTSELVTSQSQVPDLGAMTGPASVVFTLKPGGISEPVAAGRNGVVFSLLEKQEPPAADFAKDKDQIREEVLGQKRSEMMELFASSLVQRMEKEGKIRKNPKELERLMPKGAPAEGE